MELAELEAQLLSCDAPSSGALSTAVDFAVANEIKPYDLLKPEDEEGIKKY